ncbi:hypothetical protein AB9E29_33550, partial [Rhizobium leguminosarum]|uniref:hypothetical protein n=1 Tax=Rhizobium leguminosarum TaxID=384 RepID=UPI003F9730E3
ILTYGLQVMSLTSYRASPPRASANPWELLMYSNTKGRFVSGTFVSALGRRVCGEKIVFHQLRFADLAATYPPAS